MVMKYKILIFIFNYFKTKHTDTLHGGMLTALTDSVSTLALETHEKKPAKSASVELSVS